MKNSNKYFTLNFFKKQICGSKKAFAMELLEAGKSYKQVQMLTGISKSTLIREKWKL